MRVLITRRSSTKAERIFAEILKRNHIPFLHRQKIDGREIDFIIGTYAVEIDGHEQSPIRNAWLIKQGFTPLHFTNNAIRKNTAQVEEGIVQQYGSLSSRSNNKYKS